MANKPDHTVDSITRLLHQVKDPEIPTISLIDLGVITNINVDPQAGVHIKMTPTFSGCPAMDYMKNNVEEVLVENGIDNFKVEMNFETQWSSNNITTEGLKAIKKHGLAPPPKHNLIVDIDLLEKVKCPFCDSNDTSL
jgi:ring-1,2-phenylacetyl-CoA epoxidase subunit PaaD